MRLLNVEAYAHNKSLVLREFNVRKPPYAIFSHIWGSQELEFNDISSSSTLSSAQKKSKGYAKFSFLMRKAHEHGIGWIWTDTCCIDKSNSAEHSEAINSRYRWFAEAEVCIVYLDDVVLTAHQRDTHRLNEQIELRIPKSAWFRRSWTLPDLIAPKRVVFYGEPDHVLGEKTHLAPLLADITNIPTAVLTHAKQPHEYSISTRMGWSVGRRARKVEDQAYALMGLFEVSMPIVYGEGEKAMQRLLQEVMSQANQETGFRLLVANSRPLTIETFLPGTQPKYAILSHTWGYNEVTFQDVLLGRAPNRTGYKKLIECCEQAVKDGFKYVWADTCCIDKTSSAELQEALCSMYKWYEKAEICYAYLEDHGSGASVPKAFEDCKWFTRGWTLQELIAPREVEFYDAQWCLVGTKRTLYERIARRTGIPQFVLIDDGKLRNCSAYQIMSWAAGRTTSRIEDAAYSLMGLFDIYMPMLYGEGDRAFVRLQEEIMKRYEDYTLFSWTVQESTEDEAGLLARSPAAFSKSTSLPSSRYSDTLTQSMHALSWREPPVFTSRGIKISLPLAELVIKRSGWLADEGTNFSIEGEKFVMRTKGPELPDWFPKPYLALVSWTVDDSSTQQSWEAHEFPFSHFLCICLSLETVAGSRRRMYPGTLVVLPSQVYANRFKLKTVYIAP